MTGSRYLVTHNKTRVLVDCGLFQVYKLLRLRNWAPTPVFPASIGAVVLTHAHIDHTGYLPLLARQGFQRKVFCTPVTYALCRILLPDSGHLQEEEADYANRYKLSKHKEALPLYTRDDALRCLKLFHAVPFDEDWQPVSGLPARLTPSGRMVGSSFVRLDDGSRSVLFSGDIGRPNDLVLNPPVPMDGADYLVVESTYGNGLHKNADPLLELGKVINRTAARGGVVVIPAFGADRAQSLLHCIQLLKAKGVIADMPIYLNSPIAASATQVYLKHKLELGLRAAECEAMAHTAHIVQSAEESRILNARHGPMVIVAASDMATGGGVVHHLKAFASNERNTILFAGYQAGGTRNAAITRGASSVPRTESQRLPTPCASALSVSCIGHATCPSTLKLSPLIDQNQANQANPHHSAKR